MEGKKKAFDLRQRVYRLGNQKLEEEEFYKKIREAIDRPPASKHFTQPEQPKSSPNRRTDQASTS